jgi:hypothetical protein
MSVFTELMTKDETSRLSASFDKFLETRRDHRDGLDARQQLWAAFKAGADWALDEMRGAIDETR